MFLERAENRSSWQSSGVVRVTKMAEKGVSSMDYVYICTRNVLKDEK